MVAAVLELPELLGAGAGAAGTRLLTLLFGAGTTTGSGLGVAVAVDAEAAGTVDLWLVVTGAVVAAGLGAAKAFLVVCAGGAW